MNKLPSPAIIKKMVKIAMKARDNAYTPYSDHPVGVTILSNGGRLYAGANCETAHYKGVCGEASAISAMVTAGDRKITALMTVAPSNDYACTPCGDCRQRIAEFSDENTLIFSMFEDGTLESIYLFDDLLPMPFKPEHLAVLNLGPYAVRHKGTKDYRVTNKKKKKSK